MRSHMEPRSLAAIWAREGSGAPGGGGVAMGEGLMDSALHVINCIITLAS